MRLHHIIELLIIIGCLYILVSERKPQKSNTHSDKTIKNTFTYNDKTMNDETASKTTKDIRYIEAK